MFPIKFMLFAVVTLIVVGSTFAIIGGQDADHGQFPYFAYLKTYISKSDYRNWESGYLRFVCAGALVSNQWVLTAAQCLLHTDGAEVHLGLTNFNDTNEDEHEIFKVTRMNYFIYPTHHRKAPGTNDIALVELPTPVWFSKYILTIPFASSSTPLGTDVITMGFGRVSKDQKSTQIFTETLQYTKMQTVDLRECINDTTYLISKKDVICTDGAQTSLCTGDLGAPLVSANTGGLIGIAVGVNPDCANPQGFIGVSAYTQWIERVIDEVMCMKEIVKRKFQ